MRDGAELERYADGPSFVCDSLVCEEEGVRSPTFKNPRSPTRTTINLPDVPISPVTALQC